MSLNKTYLFSAVGNCVTQILDEHRDGNSARALGVTIIEKAVENGICVF